MYFDRFHSPALSAALALAEVLPGDREQQREGLLGGGDDVGGGRVDHHHAPGGGGRYLDVVQADAGPGDHLQPGRGGDRLGVDLGGAAYDHRVRLGERGEQGRPVGAVDVAHVEVVREHLDGGGGEFFGDQYDRIHGPRRRSCAASAGPSRGAALRPAVTPLIAGAMADRCRLRPSRIVGGGHNGRPARRVAEAARDRMVTGTSARRCTSSGWSFRTCRLTVATYDGIGIDASLWCQYVPSVPARVRDGGPRVEVRLPASVDRLRRRFVVDRLRRRQAVSVIGRSTQLIMPRSFWPVSSIGCAAPSSRHLVKFGRPASSSATHSRANSPDCASRRGSCASRP